MFLNFVPKPVRKQNHTSKICVSLLLLSVCYMLKDFVKASEKSGHRCVASDCVQKVLSLLCIELWYLYQSSCFTRLLGAHIHFVHLKIYLY
jgi:hypothetical protein